jgi:hypothetical protein
MHVKAGCCRDGVMYRTTTSLKVNEPIDPSVFACPAAGGSSKPGATR